MRASGAVALSASVLLVAVGCGPPTQPTPATSAPTPSGPPVASAATGDWFGINPNPLDVTVVVDDENSAVFDVGPAGGILSATGDDGTRYSLELPAGALPFETTVAMSPVESISGWPVQPLGSWAAVLEPDGLELLLDANLTIEPTIPVPSVGQAAFTFHGGGEDVGFEAFVPEADVVSVKVSHFSGHGFVWDVRQSFWVAMQDFRQGQVEAEFADKVARTIARDRERALLDDRARSDLRRSLEGMAEVLKQRGLGEIDIDAIVDDLPGFPPDVDLYGRLAQVIEEYYEKVLRPRFELGTSDCKQALRALTTFAAFRRQLTIYGAEDLLDRFTTERAAAGRPLRYPLDRMPQAILDIVRTNCDREAYEACARTGDLERLIVYVTSLRRTAQLLGAPLGPADDRHNLLELCGRYEIEANIDVDQTTKAFDPRPTFEGEWAWKATITFVAQVTESTEFSVSIAGSGSPEILQATKRTRFHDYGQSDSGVIDAGWEPWCATPAATYRPGPPMDVEIKRLAFIRVGPDAETVGLRDATIVFGPVPPVLLSRPGCGLGEGFEESYELAEVLMGGGFPTGITWPTITEWTVADHPILATRAWKHEASITTPDGKGRSGSTYRHQIDLTIRHIPGVLR